MKKIILISSFFVTLVFLFITSTNPDQQIRAPANGRVQKIGHRFGIKYLLIKYIDSPAQLPTLYLHLDKITVRENQSVKKGQLISVNKGNPIVINKPTYPPHSAIYDR